MGGFAIKSDNFLQKGILTLLSIFFFSQRGGNDFFIEKYAEKVLKNAKTAQAGDKFDSKI